MTVNTVFDILERYENIATFKDSYLHVYAAIYIQ